MNLFRWSFMRSSRGVQIVQASRPQRNQGLSASRATLTKSAFRRSNRSKIQEQRISAIPRLRMTRYARGGISLAEERGDTSYHETDKKDEVIEALDPLIGMKCEMLPGVIPQACGCLLKLNKSLGGGLGGDGGAAFDGGGGTASEASMQAKLELLDRAFQLPTRVT